MIQPEAAFAAATVSERSGVSPHHAKLNHTRLVTRFSVGSNQPSNQPSLSLTIATNPVTQLSLVNFTKVDKPFNNPTSNLTTLGIPRDSYSGRSRSTSSKICC